MRYEDEVVGKDAPVWESPVGEPETLAERGSVGKNTLLLLRDIAIAAIIIVVILQFIRPTIVFEHSMDDTLHPEDYVFLSKKAYSFSDVKLCDIIVFSSELVDERGVEKYLIKRVIGLPGDEMEIKEDAVYRNGERLFEPYTKEGLTVGEMAPVTVPPDSYFVLGDNRQQSRDSRSAEVGFITKEQLMGKVVFRLFPISHAGKIY